FRPSLSKAVFHGILSFYPGEKVEDDMMAEIAKEYLQEMNIVDTQFAIVKHTDKNHAHLHIIANLVNNNGQAIKDNWIGLKGKKVAQSLTKKYGLVEAVSKNISSTNLEALNEKEANRYIIYQAILELLPKSKNLDDLKSKLSKQNIETLYKYKGQTSELQGISFKIADYKYKGSEIDRKFSVKNLEKEIYRQALKAGSESYRQFTSNSNSKSQKSFDATGKDLKKERSLIIEQLMKPEKSYELNPNNLLLPKKRKKKSRGLSL
ncbi:MAG: relaxase/mobilization nuclease domain-containing protein, partial [Ferruginibacter sp.]